MGGNRDRDLPFLFLGRLHFQAVGGAAAAVVFGSVCRVMFLKGCGGSAELGVVDGGQFDEAIVSADYCDWPILIKLVMEVCLGHVFHEDEVQTWRGHTSR